MNNLPFLAHLLIGGYFAFFGLWNIYHWKPIIEVMIKDKVPHALFLLPVGICWQIILGFMIIFGMFTKIAALMLIPFTIIAVCMFHPYWKFTGELRRLNFSIFVANMTVTLGALVLLLNNVTGMMQWSDLLN